MELTFKTTSGKTMNLEVSPRDTIISIKQILGEEFKMEDNEQTLIYQEQTLKDLETIADYNIASGSIIHVIQKLKGSIQIIIQDIHSKKKITIDVNREYSVQALKSEIFHKWGVEVNKQILMYKGTNLLNERRLKQYRIKNYSVIILKKIVKIDTDHDKMGIEYQNPPCCHIF